MTNILIAGGSGLIGSRLSQLLSEKGYRVSHLSRRPKPGGKYDTFHWDPARGQIDETAIQQADFVINLAGAGIADKRWTEDRKRLIIESRVQGNQLLLSTWNRLGRKPRAFLSGAATGYYGDCGDREVKETDEPGIGFLAESCVAWEKSIAQIMATDIRTVAIRIGIVLSTRGGALEKMLLPLMARTSTYFGSGRQWYSWIHIDDICRLFIFALEHENAKGTYNGVAPNPVRNKELAQALPRAKGVAALVLPAPEFALRLALGELAEAILISTRVSARKSLDLGFEFAHPELEEALQHLLQQQI